MTDQPPDSSSVSRPFNPLVGIAAVVGFIALVAVIAFALSQRSDGPTTGASVEPTASLPTSDVSSPSVTTSAAASVAVEPSAPPAPPTIAWEEPAVFDGQPSEVIVDSETWVAVGHATERGPAAWTSSDAVRWERAEVVDPLPDDMFLGSGLGPTVRLGDSLLSYGTFRGCCDGAGVLGWRSIDGRSWEVIESDSRLFDEGYLVNGLAVGDTALVATEIRYSGFSSRFWRWTEESSWVETTPGTADTSDQSGVQLEDIIWADGRFVVVGTRGDPTSLEEGFTGASWTSADGQTWAESTPLPELADTALTDIAQLPSGGFVALAGRDGGIVVFTSQDGLAWTPAEGPTPQPDTAAMDIIEVDGGVVAFGSHGGFETVVWTSADGLSWTDAGRFEASFAAAAALGDRIVVFTAEYEGEVVHTIHRGTIGY